MRGCRSMAMPMIYTNPVSRGDHLITITIDIPTRVSNEERELLVQLAKIRGDRTGKGGFETFLGSLFQK